MEGSPDDYFFVYYRGSNDAWDGYGGAVVYTRSKTLPSSILPEVEAAAKSVGLDFSSFIITDNSCPPPEPLLTRLEEKVVKAGEVELRLFDRLRTGLFKEFVKDEENYLKELGREERKLFEQMGDMDMGDPDDIEDLFSNALPLRKLR